MTQAVPKIEATERVRKRIERLRALAERPGTKEEGETARRLLEAMLEKYSLPAPPPRRRAPQPAPRPRSSPSPWDAPYDPNFDYVAYADAEAVRSGLGDWLPAGGVRTFEFAVDDDGVIARIEVKSGTGISFLRGDVDVAVQVRFVSWTGETITKGRAFVGQQVFAGDLLVVFVRSHLSEAHRVSVTVEVTPMGNSR